ncbi:glycoside hydrolase family 38 C-terminal domain-containing protein [Lactiplantibacillus pingfangensis]|uniref:glycoside hydrolase family 38 N-terminal domain-containing protein n=1 Tax=Lactiplantibacillus pingfangensis TaxID=2559915 RepID=UPI001CC5D7DB|nr:glycoside hydrolase family 38 C-terminal domain-containing protein [Lactiplantibacillus pingfangensis]
MMKVTQIFVVPHMHWDREWYFSTEESQVLLLNNMPEIMTMLENHPEYPSYVLDGQSVIIEDYLSAHPEGAERFKELVKQGRLIVGPWYTQTDEMAVGAEAITRNLLYGMADSRRYGQPMKIGYVPDSFGQSAQMPMILTQFGIKRSMFWRGLSERKGTNANQFKWQSADGSTVAVNQLPAGYATGKYLPTDPVALKARLTPLLAKFDQYSTTGQAVLPNGHDQMPIQQNIEAVIAQLNQLYPDRHFQLGRYEDVFPAIEQDQDADVISGEFLDGKNERVHRSIQSTRMDLKVMNTRIENKLTNTLEPLATIAAKLGFQYEHGLIELIWKEIMKNHAHDSMGACCSDIVNEEILARYRRAEERTDRLIQYYQRKLTEAVTIAGATEKLAAFNLLPKKCDRVVTAKIVTKLSQFQLIAEDGTPVAFEILHRRTIDPGLIDRQIVAHGDYTPFYEYELQFKRQLPAMGYEVLGVIPVQKTLPAVVQAETQTMIENNYYQLTVNDNGTLTVVDKRTQTTYQRVLDLEIQADDGDEYDFSPLADNRKLYASQLNKKLSVESLIATDSSQLILSYQLLVPQNLVAWQAADLALTTSLKVSVHLTLKSDLPVIALKVTVDNQADDLRVRLLVPTQLSSKVVASDNQFGVIQRPVVDHTALAVWQKEKWDERPDAIFPFLSHVSVSDSDHQVGIITNSSREYEALDETNVTLAITLFRGVGVLGKANLVRRPGRPSGINAPTPDSQCHGKFSLTYGLFFGNNQTMGIARLAKAFLTPVTTYNQIPNVAMHMNLPTQQLPASYSLFELMTDNLTLSTVKMAENRAAVLVRVYNQTQATDSIKMAGATVKQVLGLDERPSDLGLAVKPNSVRTIELNN